MEINTEYHQKDDITKEIILKNKKSIIKNNLCGIYFLLKNEEIVYIGSSKNIFSRLSQHIDKQYDSYFIFPCEIDKLLYYEAEFIFKFKPKLNSGISSKINKDIIYIGRINDEFKSDKIELALIGNKVYAKLNRE